MAYLKIVLRSDLCAGSGESSGNTVGSDLCSNAYGLPYIPARRLKGCLRQAANELNKMGYELATKDNNIVALFGDAYGTEGALQLQDAVLPRAEAVEKYLRELVDKKEVPEAVRRAARPKQVAELFTAVRGQTKLDNGVKVDNTLRFTRVMHHYNPFPMSGETENSFVAPVQLNSDSEELQTLLETCCKATRHIGLNRNRGLGNVTITFCKEDDNTTQIAMPEWEGDAAEGKMVQIIYKVSIDAALTLPGCDELSTSIPARSVIGCMAGQYLKTGSAEEETFQKLFLDGTVRWSALTPVIEGNISVPTPVMFMKLKNGGGEYINRFVKKEKEWKHLKPKALEGTYAVMGVENDGKKECFIAAPAIHVMYHNNIEKGELYMQAALEAGMIYGGVVELPEQYISEVLELLSKCSMRFGRSRNVQYATCSLCETPEIKVLQEELVDVADGEVVYVVLQSDLILEQSGCYLTNQKEVRALIADKLGLDSALPAEQMDCCLYRTIGGYQTMWHLQKHHIPVVQGGSVYCFRASGKSLPAEIVLGEYQQEGFGRCRVFSQSQMEQLSSVQKGTIDHRNVKLKTESKFQIESSLLVVAGIEAMRKYAREYQAVPDQLPIGRLRLILSEVSDYTDLLKRVNTVKESDISSDNKEGKKGASLKLLHGFYGEKTVELERLLSLEEGLYEAVKKDSKAQALLEKKWKLPLEILLHSLHYAKER